MTDAGLEALRGIPIADLNICGTAVTDAGVEHLCGLPLVRLDVSGCRSVTPSGVALLREMFPGLDVLSGPRKSASSMAVRSRGFEI